MDDNEKPKGFITNLCHLVFFLPVFAVLLVLGILKVAVFGPLVFLVIAFGDVGIIVGLWPCHLVWSIYCIARAKRFGPCMKCLLILMVPLLIALWTVIGVVGSVIMGIGYGFVSPIMETFRPMGMEGYPMRKKLIRCLLNGTWTNIWGAYTIVQDFLDFSFHSYFSWMDELLEWKGDKVIELKISQVPGCIFCAIVGVLVDMPIFAVLVLYKSPILLFKGWHRLVQDLIGREGPFLETVCVPIAGLLILLWPAVVLLASLAGVISSFFYGCYAAVIVYQESSIRRGLLYVVASVSLFDESTNDLLFLQEGSCFPRPNFRKVTTSDPSLVPIDGLPNQTNVVSGKEPLAIIPSEKVKPLSATMIWNNFFIACAHVGKVLYRSGAIQLSDLETWQHSKNKIISNGIPAYAFLECFLRSIKSKSPGFLMRDNVALTRSNKPAGKVFDWLFDPMSIMKEQLHNLKLTESEELYLYKFCLYNGDKSRIDAWHNGGYPPEDEIRKAQLEGICRRLQGYCLSLSRLPTYRRRYFEVVKEIEEEAKQPANVSIAGNLTQTLV